MIKPFLKWAGGKQKLLPVLKKFYPQELLDGKIKNYYEPFLGGGAVFCDVASNYNVEQFYLNDLNKDLMNVWKIIKRLTVYELDDFIKTCKYIESDYNDVTIKEEMYYTFRKNFNERYDVENHIAALRFLFLNKAGFNGLCRYNKNGEFNVPFGKRQKISLIDENNLMVIKNVINRCELTSTHFCALVDKPIKPNSFIYFDPPYRPLNKTSSFTAYTKTGFNDEDQINLSGLFRIFDKQGAKLMLSNSFIADGFFDELYKGFNINYIQSSRSINCNGEGRNKVTEILVTNY